MAQVYSFVDENGVTRLFAEINPDPVPAAGSLVPVGSRSGVTLDTTTYDDPVRGGGAKLATLMFATEGAMLAFAQAGDAFPRAILTSDPTDGWYFGDGTVDAYASGVNLAWAVGASARLSVLNPVQASPAAHGNQLARIEQVSPAFTITTGALSTVQLVSATGARILTSRDAETITPCTFNPGAATTATVTVALSPDNVTYSTLAVVTEPAGVALDGTILPVKVRVPAGWYLKLTVNAQAVLGVTTYY